MWNNWNIAWRIRKRGRWWRLCRVRYAYFKMESIRKLSNFNSQWKKNLVPWARPSLDSRQTSFTSELSHFRSQCRLLLSIQWKKSCDLKPIRSYFRQVQQYLCFSVFSPRYTVSLWLRHLRKQKSREFYAYLRRICNSYYWENLTFP